MLKDGESIHIELVFCNPNNDESISCNSQYIAYSMSLDTANILPFILYQLCVNNFIFMS